VNWEQRDALSPPMVPPRLLARGGEGAEPPIVLPTVVAGEGGGTFSSGSMVGWSRGRVV
jgi:hypothetical protein